MDEIGESERIVRLACASPVLRRLDTLSRELTGISLIVLWTDRRTRATNSLPAGNEVVISGYCRLMHGIPEGRRRCDTCHALLSYSVSGGVRVTESRCHGGVSVLVAPVLDAGLGNLDIVVVSSCAFARRDRRVGWEATRDRAQGLGIDLQKLRRAYFELPQLHGARLKTALALVDTAATVVAEEIRQRHAAQASDAKAPRSEAGRVLRTALKSASGLGPQRLSGSVVVDVVRAVVEFNPQLQFSLTDIAEAVHVTPNHFSMLFHKHVGERFSEFLAARRIEAAKRALADATLSIADVADRCGFTDANYFSRRFHEATGVSPREWRVGPAGRGSDESRAAEDA